LSELLVDSSLRIEDLVGLANDFLHICLGITSAMLLIAGEVAYDMQRLVESSLLGHLTA